jgi:type I restriction enzyme, S subunit
MKAPDRSYVPDWLKGVPPDWDIALLKLVARVESGHTPSRNHPEYWVPEECTIPWFSLADIWQLREGRQKYLGDTKEKISPLGMANSAARILPSGTVVLSRTASVGFSGIMPRSMATTQDFVNFVCGKKLLPGFLLWALRGMRSELERLRMGSTHQTIYMPDLLQFRVPVIPIDRQQAIANFLDQKTAAIDALIERKQRLIALLAEKRAAVIHRAVTTGLSSNLAMKESGAEWIGNVPVHWTLKMLKFVCTLQRGLDLPAQDRREGSVPIIGLS